MAIPSQGSCIRDLVTDWWTLGDEIIGKEDGMEKLIAYLESVCMPSMLWWICGWNIRFIGVKRRESQPINDFIAEYEMEHAKT